MLQIKPYPMCGFSVWKIVCLLAVGNLELWRFPIGTSDMYPFFALFYKRTNNVDGEHDLLGLCLIIWSLALTIGIKVRKAE